MACTTKWKSGPSSVPSNEATEQAEVENALQLVESLEAQLRSVEQELRDVVAQRSDEEEQRYLALVEQRLELTVQLAQLHAAVRYARHGLGDPVLLPADAAELARRSERALSEAEANMAPRVKVRAGAPAPVEPFEPGPVQQRAESFGGPRENGRSGMPKKAATRSPVVSRKGGPVAVMDRAKEASNAAPEDWDEDGGRGGGAGVGQRRIERAVVRADAPPAGVMTAVEARLAEIQACLPAEVLAEGFYLDVTTRLSSEGRLVGARFGGAIQLPPLTESCIVDVLNSVQAPIPPGGSRTVTIPLWLMGP